VSILSLGKIAWKCARAAVAIVVWNIAVMKKIKSLFFTIRKTSLDR